MKSKEFLIFVRDQMRQGLDHGQIAKKLGMDLQAFKQKCLELTEKAPGIPAEPKPEKPVKKPKEKPVSGASVKPVVDIPKEEPVEKPAVEEPTEEA